MPRVLAVLCPLRLAVAGLLILSAGVFAASPALAESPVGCTAAGSDVSLNTPVDVVRVGDDVAFVATVSNDGPKVCDETGVTVTLRLPSPDGKLTGATVALASNLNLPAGTPPTKLPAVHYTVAADADVTELQAEVKMTGTGHFPTGDAITTSSQIVDVLVTHPHVTLTVTPDRVGGAPPLPVTYTYTATNDSTFDPDPRNPQVGLSAPALTDDGCAPVVLTGGDADVDGLIDRGETWTYRCARTFAVAGAFTGHVTLTGLSTRDGRSWPLTTAQSTVTAITPATTTTATTTTTTTTTITPAPRCVVTASATQRLLRSRRTLQATVRCDRAATVALGARVVVAGRRLTASGSTQRIAATTRTTVTVTLSARQRSSILAALRHRRRVTVALTLGAEAAGRRATTSATIHRLSAPRR